MNSRMLERFREYVNVTQFNAIKIGLASAEKIRSLSYGKITKIETINYRTLKPEKDGLFCPRIFGPVKDWECNCGKYKRMKHRGVTCEKCGVEVIQSRVRRERMGHIELVAPVCHIWYLKGIPSYLGLILDLPVKDLERIVYFDAYIVIHQGKSPYPRKTLLSNNEYVQYVDAHPDDFDFKADSGAEAIKELLALLDLKFEIIQLEEEYRKTASVAMRHKIMRRIKVFSNLSQAELKPEWMILNVLPVLPPDLRPLVPLEGGRFASSDLNELYRRVLNRNIRLQRLIEIDAPSVIIKNEKRMLQEAVDALVDNGRRGQPVRGSNRRPLKSLSEMLRGKQGRFRQNLLGRRVDYSGRSVIVVNPNLRMDQCGIPKVMAIELFKSYIYAELLKREIAPNLRVAKKMVEDLDPVVWDILEDVVKDRPVLLNRAPTLHRLGIQAFYPILVEGKAITIHPLVCAAFNADFDGDMMAVHLPLSKKAQLESKNLMLSVRNILSPANGKPITVPSQDMVLGLYYLSKIRMGVQGEGLVFANLGEVITAYQCEQVHLHAQVKVRIDGNLIVTTPGRVLLYEALPKNAPFDLVNRILKKTYLVKLVEKIYYQFGNDAAVETLDKIKKLGFYYSTVAGISFSLKDLIVPPMKQTIIEKAEKEVDRVEQLYIDGVITDGERNNKVLSIWGRATDEVGKEVFNELEIQDQEAFNNVDKSFAAFNPVFMMLDSGSRGSKEQIRQLVGMRGPMSKPSGEIMETPVKSNFKDGLSVFEYFISTHGARKGQSDTALKTANSGYLTRRLVDVAQDVTVVMDDCKTLGYVTIEDLKESDEVIYPLSSRVFGRVLATDAKDPITGTLLLKQGTVISREDVDILANSAIAKIQVRSVLTCQAKRGVCVQCYGYDLSRGSLVDIGTTVGIIAAQSIGEPGTQLTMKTFHIGGTASGLTAQPFFVAKQSGIVQLRGIKIVENRQGEKVNLSRKAKLVIVSKDGRELQSNDLEYGSTVLVQDGQEVSVGTKLVIWDPNSKVILTEYKGIAEFVDLIENVTIQERFDETTNRSNQMVLDHRGEKYQPALRIVDKKSHEEIAHYFLPPGSLFMVNRGQEVQAGDVLVRIPREVQKNKDITGGLTRIAELFEARVPKNPAIIADIDGEVVFGGLYRGLRKVSVIAGATSYDYYVARGEQLNVMNGDYVQAGDLLTAGSPVLHDMLRILGPDVVQKYLVNQIQEIYRLQGIDISDKHIELVVRQMIRKVRIVDPGDTDFLIGDRVDRTYLMSVNAILRAEGKKVAVAKPVLMGLTQASLATESWISAASFQDTTRILTEAAISGQADHLHGLKERVTVGKLISAGTGISSFRKKYLGNSKSDLENQAHEQEMRELGMVDVK